MLQSAPPFATATYIFGKEGPRPIDQQVRTRADRFNMKIFINTESCAIIAFIISYYNNRSASPNFVIMCPSRRAVSSPTRHMIYESLSSAYEHLSSMMKLNKGTRDNGETSASNRHVQADHKCYRYLALSGQPRRWQVSRGKLLACCLETNG